MFHSNPPSAENLNLEYTENQGGNGYFTDTRLAKKNKNIDYNQDMPPSRKITTKQPPRLKNLWVSTWNSLWDYVEKPNVKIASIRVS